MLFGRLASAALLTLAASAAVAYADPVTVSGTYSVTDTSASTDKLGLTIVGDATNPLTEQLNVGQTVIINPFVTIMTTDPSTTSLLRTASLNWQMNFTQPSAGTGSLGGVVGESVLNLFGSVSSDGTLTWSGGNGCVISAGCNTQDVFFSDGAEVAFTLGDSMFTNSVGSNDSTTIGATEELLKAPTSVTPEPASLALLATGLIGLPLLMRKHFAA
jgi:hypothetical protein